jgi:HAE1 family hydrophobic/amphiphilic exporter-1
MYRSLLDIALRHRSVVLVSAFVVFVLSLFMTNFIGKEFIPSEDQSRFVIRLQAPIDYSVEQVDRMNIRVEEIVKTFPEVRTVLYSQGGGLTREVNRANMMLNLKPKAERKKSQEQIKAEVRRAIRQIPGIKASVEDVSMIGGGQRQVPIIYSIRGRDLKTLETYSKDIASRYAKLPN